MRDLREVELRIAVAQGVLTPAEADALGDEARRAQQSPLRILVERGVLSDDSFQSLFAAALNDSEYQGGAGGGAAGAAGGGGHDGTASTFTMHPAPATEADQAFPVAAWDRYTSVRFLGKGGMGNVFLAIDTRLRREVAIKFVRGDHAEHVRRLIVEARTQARVKHPRVCQVYEVGEVDGKVFIAMQYIHGAPLSRCTGLTLEQKVMAVRGAADGIHEAHRQGIVHRDIKPSNIMIERGDDGEIRPFVVDFGLARWAQEAGTTVIGALLGTPHYMSPEQAGGDPAKLDRRADVYSLGATLYQLLTGATPMPDGTVTQVLHNLATSEPRAPRALDPSIPVDLEAIVLRCLEKDRAARYDSARALVDDLDRFLDGEPVAARPAGAWYRLRKRIAKHRRLAATGAVAVAALGFAIGWGIQASSEAAAREAFARRFTELVEDIEARARYSGLSPAHDVEPDRAALRDRMAQLAREIDAAGDVAAGPGHYALGRGYLALDDAERAHTELDLAWQGGFRELRVAYAEAQALGRLYQRGLIAVARIEDRTVREARQREIEKTYRGPALSFLTMSQGAAVSSLAYTSALSAFYRDSSDEALVWLDRGGGEPPWFYEAPQLRGEIRFTRGFAAMQAGRYDRARAEFADGRRAYLTSAAIGESVPALYASLADLEYAAMVLELYSGSDVKPGFQRALAAAVQALALAPRDYDALVLSARVRRSYAEYQVNHGGDAAALLTEARTAAERAIEVSPTRSEARRELAEIFRQWGDFEMKHGRDASALFRQAVTAFDAVGAEDRDAAYYGSQGLLFSLWADYEDGKCGDSRANRGKAIDAFAHSLRLNPGAATVWTNLGIDRFNRASRPAARDSDTDLREAIAALDRATKINADQWVPYFYRGRSHTMLAAHARARGDDPTPELRAAEDAHRLGLDHAAQVSNLRLALGLVLKDQAQAAWDRGDDPEPLLAQASAEFERAIAIDPKLVFGPDNLGALAAQRAQYQRAEGRDASAAIAAALAQLKRAREQSPDDEASVRPDLGMTYVIQAAYELDRGGDPRSALVRAEQELEEALASDACDVQSRRYLAETAALRAQLAVRQGRGDPRAFADAAAAFDRAIALDPDSPDLLLAQAELDRAWAAWLVPPAGATPQPDAGAPSDSPLARGLALAGRLVARHPRWADALVLRARLTLVQAEGEPDPAQRRSHAESAAHDFAAARAIHPALVTRWQRDVSRAQQLAAAP